MNQKLPAYMRFAPYILVVFLSALVYTGVSLLDREYIGPAARDASTFIDDARKAVEQIEKFLSEARRMEDMARETARRKTEKKQAAQAPALSKTALVIADFSAGPVSGVELSLRKSGGAQATFGVEKTGTERAAKLSINDMGGAQRKFVSAVIHFEEPVPVAGKRALEVRVRGEGLESFGLAALSKHGALYYRWDTPRNGIGAGWTTVTVPFSVLNLWIYDNINKKYRNLDKRVDPQEIQQVRFYMKSNNLTKAPPAALWVESVALR